MEYRTEEGRQAGSGRTRWKQTRSGYLLLQKGCCCSGRGGNGSVGEKNNGVPSAVGKLQVAGPQVRPLSLRWHCAGGRQGGGLAARPRPDRAPVASSAGCRLQIWPGAWCHLPEIVELASGLINDTCPTSF